MSCQHETCKCSGAEVPSDGRTYCSERCVELQQTGGHEERCSCGHAACESGRREAAPTA